MSDLSPTERLAKLRAVEEWLAWQLQQTRQRIRDLEAQTPRYALEPKQHPKHPQPALIHLADCRMPNRATSPVEADTARIGLTKDADNIAPCDFCRPDVALGIVKE